MWEKSAPHCKELKKMWWHIIICININVSEKMKKNVLSTDEVGCERAILKINLVNIVTN